ncbi:MAG TPA: TonB-dependent receptor [Candidatus Acidoferrum sp.]|nr:TonB-dependent receptor [Candidatus Acidoferrum sp.]
MCRILQASAFLISWASTTPAQTTSVVEGLVSDQHGLAVQGAEIQIGDAAHGISQSAFSGGDGAYQILGLPAGTYVVTTSKSGFATQTQRNLELSVNRTFILNIVLNVGGLTEKVEVSDAAPLLESSTSSTGTTILPEQIDQMPINGRNYLDLLQLVPGVGINRQQDPSLDGATPILGERGGNAVFLIDGMPNEDEVNGGAAAQFNQDSILEFQVITGGYKAEFGHGSGGIINVLSKSGTNDWHGGASFFHRNYKLDSSDSPLVLAGNVPFVLRYDPSAQVGGPILKDKIFFFGSAERILESRQLNFQFPQNTPPTLIQFETPFNLHTQSFETRTHAKLDELWGRHRLTQQFNLTNTHVTDFLPLLQAINLPSTRNDVDSRSLLLGFSDTALLGKQGSPFLLTWYMQYRGEPSDVRPAHPEAGTASTLANLFSSLNTGGLFGDQPQVKFGAGHTTLSLDQKYLSLGANLAKEAGRHTWKLGWDFQRTHVDGVEASNLLSQLFATTTDFQTFGAVDSGVYFLNVQGGVTPRDNLIALRNNYNGAFAQDDWKLFKNTTLNLGLRWDYDNRFPNKTNFSPRVGFAWSITPKTVLRASWGLFYDHFRLGLARDIPGFGGATLVQQTFLSFPRLFYGDPSTLTNFFASLGLPVPCASSNLSDAQIQSMGLKCSAKFPNGANQPLYGFDHLNTIVAPGHSPVPANAVVNLNDVQALTGFTPQQFADAVSSAVGLAPGSFSYDPFGNLSIGSKAFPTSGIPIAVDPGFKTPYTNGFNVGLQRQLTPTTVIQVNYYHKSINNILGLRDTNLAFEARIPGHLAETVPGGSPLVFGYGPWLHGSYDAVTLGVTKRMSKSLSLDASYTWTHETDNALNSNFVSDLQTNLGAGLAAATGPTDSFVGMTTLVTDPVTGQTNATGPFTASNGNPVPKAGIFYDGPNLDKGPSDLALNHTFLLSSLVQLPWKMDFSGIFRAQSGFHYSAEFATTPPDVDGDGHFNGVDFLLGRNHFVAPTFVNLDARIAKRFDYGERLKFHVYIEFFNLFNRANPAAVESLPRTNSTSTAAQFGEVLQVLPGREGQVGIRIEF